ncbi:MAG: selenide, water dikinase SelD [Gemmatimonadaceae bacterium]
MGPGDLSRALEGLPSRSDSRLLVGHETLDDAGVFLLSDDVALVQTVDFFAPIVDDPYLFGQVAAANALSDVYAMGGEPLTALNIVGFPSGKLPLEVLREILRGGQEKVHEAGALVVGGHTIIDEELKYGLSVTGRAHPARLLTNASARAGDRLVLTKPIGTALLATLAKRGELPEPELLALTDSMRALNRRASEVALQLGVRCATDVTGFGLLGHASHIARSSGVTLRIRMDHVPLLPGARSAADRGVRTGGAERNLAYLEPQVEWGRASETDRVLAIDPQTSGGLLVALSADVLERYVSLVPGATEIGDVLPPGKAGLVLA